MPFIAFQEENQVCPWIGCSGLGSWHWKDLTHTISDRPLEDRQTQSHSQGFLPLFLKYLLTTEKGVDPSLLFLLVCSQWQIKREPWTQGVVFPFFLSTWKTSLSYLHSWLQPQEKVAKDQEREGLLTYFQSASSGWIKIYWYVKEDPCYIL